MGAELRDPLFIRQSNKIKKPLEFPQLQLITHLFDSLDSAGCSKRVPSSFSGL